MTVAGVILRYAAQPLNRNGHRSEGGRPIADVTVEVVAPALDRVIAHQGTGRTARGEGQCARNPLNGGRQQLIGRRSDAKNPRPLPPQQSTDPSFFSAQV